MEKKKVDQVSIGCKIGTDTYPYFEKDNVIGDEIVEHLLSDCESAWIEDEDHPEGGYIIPGDLCIWYLGTNEKFGSLYIKLDGREWQWSWGFGESNFGFVTEFVTFLKQNQIITTDQCRKLMDAIRIGKTIGDMYLIRDYLQTVKEEKVWIPKITHTKQHIKKMVKDVCETFKQKGYDFKPTLEGRHRSGPDEVS